MHDFNLPSKAAMAMCHVYQARKALCEGSDKIRGHMCRFEAHSEKPEEPATPDTTGECVVHDAREAKLLGPGHWSVRQLLGDRPSSHPSTEQRSIMVNDVAIRVGHNALANRQH